MKLSEQFLADFLDDYLDKPHYTKLTSKKIYDRAQILDDNTFTVERHRSILGCQYKQGLPMSAYATYWPIYEFIDGDIVETKDTYKPDELDENEIDYCSLAEDNLFDVSFSIEETDSNEFLLTESCSNFEHLFYSEKEIRSIAKMYCKEFDSPFIFDDIPGNITPDIKNKIKDNFLQTICELVESKINDAWECRE